MHYPQFVDSKLENFSRFRSFPLQVWVFLTLSNEVGLTAKKAQKKLLGFFLMLDTHEANI